MHVLHLDRAGAKSIWELMGHIAKESISKGWRITFVMWDDGKQPYSQDVPEGVDVITIRVPPKRNIWDLVQQHWVFVREFRKILRKIKPDIVHTNFAVPSIVARWAAAREKVPVIVSTQHELYGSMHFHYRWGLRLTERYCTAITYVSKTVADSFGRSVEIGASNPSERDPLHSVIPNGVDISKIRAAIATAGERIPGRIICAGRMVPVKGQQLLIEALPEVVRQYPHICLHLIGTGPMEDALRHRVEELGLADKVKFLGWQSHEEVLREMASAELVVVPSDGSQEGFGLVVAEALVCGTTILVSDIPVFREVLDGFYNRSRFFTAGDCDSLVKEFSRHHFSGAGVPVVTADEEGYDLEQLSADYMANKYFRLYRTILSDHHRDMAT